MTNRVCLEAGGNSENDDELSREGLLLGSHSVQNQTDHSCYLKTASADNRVRRRKWTNKENRIVMQCY